jgi:Zn-finger nucleic acid-binding protein
MQCALCEASCVPEPVGAITLDRCSGCGALWFDRTELAGAFHARVPGLAVDWGRPLPAPADEGPQCPRTADVRLRSYELLGQRFWRCPRCQGVLMTASAWHGMVATAERRLQERHQRLGVLDGAQIILEILGAGFS